MTNNNDVVILARVGTPVAAAGASAAQEAARLRRARRRWLAWAGVLGGVGAGAIAGARAVARAGGDAVTRAVADRGAAAGGRAVAGRGVAAGGRAVAGRGAGAAGHFDGLSFLASLAHRGLLLAAVVALVGAVVAAVASVSFDPHRWERGSAGERATAAELARLARRGWAVWHDLGVPGSRANIDHVVVGRTGVWVVDSKTTRAEVRARWWRGVHFGSHRLDTAPVRWEAEVVSDGIRSQLGRTVAVRPIVAVHGRGLQRRGGRESGVRVVPAAEVVRRIRRGRRRLGRSELTEVAGAIEAFLARRRP